MLTIGVLAIGALASCRCGKSPPPAAARVPVPTPIARAAYVTNNGSDSISVIDRDGTTVTDVAIDVDPDAHEAPHHLAIDVADGSLFVALAYPPEQAAAKKNDPHAAHGRGTTLGQLARLDLATLGVDETREVDENPGDVVLTHDRKHVLVTHFDMKRAMTAAAAGGHPSTLFATLQVWDRATLTKTSSRSLCVAPHGVITTKDDRTAIVACYGSDELAVVDLGSTSLATARYPLGPAQGVLGAPKYGPYSALLSPDEKRIVVADLEGADVRIFDVETKRFLAEQTLTLGSRVMMADFVSADVVVAPLQSPDGLARLDVTHGAVLHRIAFTKAECELPHVVRKAKDGRVYVVCEGDHTSKGAVLEVDPETLATKHRYVVGVYPDGIVFGD
ncbi:MAG: Surface antigen protein [Myxococcaceae bacterium]|nr:Surface antigen protein [Myxococcaceae bacterium]